LFRSVASRTATTNPRDASKIYSKISLEPFSTFAQERLLAIEVINTYGTCGAAFFGADAVKSIHLPFDCTGKAFFTRAFFVAPRE
jgi:hypothetical protein